MAAIATLAYTPQQYSNSSGPIAQPILEEPTKIITYTILGGFLMIIKYNWSQKPCSNLLKPL